MINDGDLAGALAKLETLPLERLQVSGTIADLVRQAGTTHELDRAGLWQDPDQFERLCLTLLQGPPIRTVLEIGSWSGHSLAILSGVLFKKTPLLAAVSIDTCPERLHPTVLALPYLFQLPGTSEILKEPGRVQFEYDLVVIDGHHSYAWAKKDWDNAGKHAKVACAFHDVDPDWNAIGCAFGHPNVQHLWKELKADHRHTEILSGKQMGWGVLWTHK